MDIVVDTSVIIATIANEPVKEQLIELTRGADLLAPHSVHWEIGNALSAMLRRRRITIDEAETALRMYRSIPVRFVDVELEDALRIADSLGIYAYDGYLIRCARKYNAPLISLDRRLVGSARQMKVKVLEVPK